MSYSYYRDLFTRRNDNDESLLNSFYKKLIEQNNKKFLLNYKVKYERDNVKIIVKELGSSFVFTKNDFEGIPKFNAYLVKSRANFQQNNYFEGQNLLLQFVLDFSFEPRIFIREVSEFNSCSTIMQLLGHKIIEINVFEKIDRCVEKLFETLVIMNYFKNNLPSFYKFNLNDSYKIEIKFSFCNFYFKLNPERLILKVFYNTNNYKILSDDIYWTKKPYPKLLRKINHEFIKYSTNIKFYINESNYQRYLIETSHYEETVVNNCLANLESDKLISDVLNIIKCYNDNIFRNLKIWPN